MIYYIFNHIYYYTTKCIKKNINFISNLLTIPSLLIKSYIILLPYLSSFLSIKSNQKNSSIYTHSY